MLLRSIRSNIEIKTRELYLRTFDNTTADRYLVADIEVVRWEQYGLGNAMPFNAMWYTVPPGSASPPDCHPEIELSIVVSGLAAICTDGVSTGVAQGGAFLIDSGETHLVRNASADEPLVVFSAYWMPAAQPSTGATEVHAHA